MNALSQAGFTAIVLQVSILFEVSLDCGCRVVSQVVSIAPVHFLVRFSSRRRTWLHFYAFTHPTYRARGIKFSGGLSFCLCAFSALTLLVGRQEGHPACKKLEWWVAGMVIWLEQGADLHMAQLMPLPLTVSCFSKIQIGFTFLVPAHPGSPGKRAVKRVWVCKLSTNAKPSAITICIL